MKFESGSRLLAGKYRLLRPLGQGGMGTVWYAEHLSLRSSVAVKLLEPHIAEDPQGLQRFWNEARAAAALRSPHVVQILDHGVDEGTPFIVMELLEGECLSERLQRKKTLSPVETARIVTHVARALSRAHEAGIVHRDLKPGNVFIVHDDEEEIAKLFDFGIAKSRSHALSMRADATTIPGTLVGTPYYMSPEQAQGGRTDHRSDIWALGVIAFECLLGRRPFEAEALGSLLLRICSDPMPVPSGFGPVPDEFDAWFARACARDLAHRFGSAREAAAALRVVCRVEHHSPDSPTPESPKGGPRGYAWLPVAILGGLTLGGVTVWAVANFAPPELPVAPTEFEPPSKATAAQATPPLVPAPSPLVPPPAAPVSADESPAPSGIAPVLSSAEQRVQSAIPDASAKRAKPAVPRVAVPRRAPPLPFATPIAPIERAPPAPKQPEPPAPREEEKPTQPQQDKPKEPASPSGVDLGI